MSLFWEILELEKLWKIYWWCSFWWRSGQMALWAGGGQKLFNWGMRWEHWSGNERGRRGAGGVTALSEWSSFLAEIRGTASLSLLVLRGTSPSCPCWSKVLNSRNYLPDNCCTEGWSCVLNNCAWMVSTTLLKRRLGPVRREEAQMAVRGAGAESSYNPGWRGRITSIFPSVLSPRVYWQSICPSAEGTALRNHYAVPTSTGTVVCW